MTNDRGERNECGKQRLISSVGVPGTTFRHSQESWMLGNKEINTKEESRAGRRLRMLTMTFR